MAEKEAPIQRQDSPKHTRVPLECPPIDAMLGGGVETGTIIEIYGEAGSGKTNICIQFAKNIVKSGKKAIFIDTEGVSWERLEQIFSDGAKPLLKDILFYQPTDMEEQDCAIESAIKLCYGELDVGAIILDSSTIYYRYSFNTEVDADNRKSLAHQINKLLAIARKMDIPVILTSQVYTDLTRKRIEPLGGHILHHAAKTIIKLEKVGGGVRRATVMKHRSIAEESSADFRLTEKGAEGCFDGPG